MGNGTKELTAVEIKAEQDYDCEYCNKSDADVKNVNR